MAKVFALLAAKTDEIRVTHWRLLQTYHPRWHVFGRFGAGGGFWITPPLVFQDVRRLVAEAANGKRYRLIGEPGMASMAASFVECCATFDARLACTVDVTADFLDLRRRMVGEGSDGSQGEGGR
ncbi:hypothetical protein AB4156_30130 [Cupriavidus sp. 2MCAB6]|uniref:hypothetical protein n=1 Tax=Cupriavidus sp. 2MCAB6 TaxID=3232981 RepID=UPI003F8FBB0E